MPTFNTTPKKYGAISPYLIVDDPKAAIEYYENVFGAIVEEKLETNEGIVHAELNIGGSTLMMGCEYPSLGFHSPKKYGGSPVNICVYIDDVDSIFASAIEGGGNEYSAIVDKFYGDRVGSITDPFGHVWTILSHIEDVSNEEMKRRIEELGDNVYGERC